MLIPLLSLLNLATAPAGSLDFQVVEVVRHLRLQAATITVDGTVVGATNGIGVFRKDGVATGTHALTISLPGYNDFSGTFNVVQGSTPVQEFELIPFVNQFLLKGPERSQPYSRNTDTWAPSRLTKPEDRGCRH